MAEKKRKKKLKKKQMRNKILLVALGGAAVILLLFFLIFQVRYVTVNGNTKYTDEEIRKMVLDDPIANNSLFASLFRKHVDMSEVPFMEYAEIEFLNYNSILIDVTEKKPVGYIFVGNNQVYFDKDGIAIEILPYELENANTEGPPLSEQGALSSETIGEEALSSEALESEAVAEEQIPSENVQSARVSVSEFQPSLEKVPLVTGIYVRDAQANQKLDVSNQAVFRTMLALIRMIEKYDISPEAVAVREDGTLILHYFKSVRVNLGYDEELEEKMTKLAAMLPDLEGLAGVLHMENYSEESHSFVFEQDAPDDGASPEEYAQGLEGM